MVNVMGFVGVVIPVFTPVTPPAPTGPFFILQEGSLVDFIMMEGGVDFILQE